MGRKRIELEFYDKKYTIEFNRTSVREVIKTQDDDNTIQQVINLVKSGLIMHHKDNMPSDDEVFGWLIGLGDGLGSFAEALRDMVQDVLEVLKNDGKNLKWGKVED